MIIRKRIKLIRSPREAFTLVEVMVGVAIFAAATLALYSGMTYCITTSDAIRKNQRATQIVLQTFELVRLYDWDQITKTGFLPSTIFADDFSLWTRASTNTPIYTGSVQNVPAPMSESYAGDLRLITVNLTWNGGGGIVRTRSMSTLVARQGLQNYVY